MRAYITEWQRFYTQAQYLPMPFMVLETTQNQGGRSPSMMPRSSYGNLSSINTSQGPKLRDTDNIVKRVFV